MKPEILYGIHPVTEALEAHRRTCFEIYITPDRSSGALAEVIERASALSLPIKTISSSQLSHLCGSEAHQGIAAKVSPCPLADIDDLTARPPADKAPVFLVLLDGIVDPQNMGALVRTALCAGVTGIVFPKDRSATPLPSVSKASAGAMEHLPMAMVTNLSATIQHLKHSGLWIAGLDRSAAQSIYDVDLSGPVAIVIGGEEKGIRPLVKKQCDFLISIPQTVGFNSLNASAAGAIVMYEAVRQRKALKQ